MGNVRHSRYFKLSGPSFTGIYPAVRFVVINCKSDFRIYIIVALISSVSTLLILGDHRKFAEQYGDIIQWNESNRAYILTHSVSGVNWSHYMRDSGIFDTKTCLEAYLTFEFYRRTALLLMQQIHRGQILDCLYERY